MKSDLENIKNAVELSGNLKESEKEALLNSIKKMEKEVAILEFKLDRTEKVKRTTSVLLEETIEELEKKRKDIEKHNRELEIEGALERVRSRTMAMQKSDELADTAVELSDQLRNLNLLPENSRVFFSLLNTETETAEVWMTQTDGKFRPGSHHIPLTKEKELARLYKLWKKNEPLIIRDLSGKKLADYYDFLKTLPHVTNEEGFRKILDNPPARFVLTEATHKYGTIGVTSFEPLPNEAQDVLIRFSQIFEQTYTRFLDLQKAEAQTREAEIQLALERVRARTMAMHKSEELSDTASIMFQELKKLGLNSLRTGVCIFDFDDDSAELWLSTEDGDNTETKVLGKVYGNMHPMYRNWIDAGAQKKKMFRYKISGKEVPEYYEVATSPLNLPKQTVYNKSEIYNGFFFPEGSINIISLNSLTEEECDIGYRFANVFGLLYRRFLDLKKAEEQAREARIEAALERVRSRTMGMQKSAELQEVINRIFIEITGLDVEMDSSYIITHLDEDITRGFATWVSSKELSYASKLHMAYINHPLVHKFYEAWNNKEPWFSASFTKEEKNRYFKHQFIHSPELSQIPEARKKVILDGNGWSISWVILKNAAIIIQRYQNKPFSDNEVSIQKRFARVFEQTYTRFLDLKNAEAQAHEAIRQASLDRVRGEIASMRNSDDLNRITPVIWRELQALEVPFIRCGVFIVDEITQIIHVYLSTPEGKALGVLNLDFDANELTKNTVEHWRMKRIFRTNWNKGEFINWTKSMMELGQVKSAETYQGAEEAPESLSLHFVPFKQGMLYVGDISPLSDDKINLVKTLAEAFSIAYARYEDFKNLEEAKNKIESTLHDLKAAQTQLIHAEKMASLGELTAGIAHEIQNPLNFVNNFSEVSIDLIEEMLEEVESGNSDEVKLISTDLKENLQKIRNHGQRASGIVKGMLQHSRGSTGQKELIDINTMADEYLRLAYHGFKAKDKSFNSDFKLETDETLPKIEIVPQEIGRVLLNLINNAFYAVSQKAGNSDKDYKPEIVVKTKKLNGMLEIKIKDNGPGIPENIKNKIFQPFFTTKPTGQGTGLGLSLSYDIVTKGHNGKMELESTENKGTEFIINDYLVFSLKRLSLW